MAKSLTMVFTAENGKKVSFNLNNVKDSVTDAQVSDVMNAIITKNVFKTSAGSLKNIESASLTDKNVTNLSVK